MTKVHARKVVAYRPDRDVVNYLNRMQRVNPDTSLNEIVDALVRHTIQQMNGVAPKIRSIPEVVEGDV